ncbi:hypothetical protein Pth03_23920 [Planotetraspora thailandica]|uniref:TIGR02234 family membrane protein n=1 Tax=Planotetraspora thailandica TaxID=487172 RepID=A0A8J3XY87_9ACTN|nr:TIGR02234 family membrane protein [Planotetraspora thailandica]GII54003.1 hypothetical protein Pth03_23920 [Planotetraspora thailandica]
MTTTDGTRAPAPGRTARRSLMIWLVASAAGAGLALLASGRTWATVVFAVPAGGVPGSGDVPVTGGELVAYLTPAALAALAATVAVLAARGLARRAIALVISLCGVAVVAGSWTAMETATIVAVAREHATTVMMASHGAPAHSPAWAWPALAMAGGVVLVAAGLVAAVRGGRWPGMSSRYDRPDGGSRTGSQGRPRRATGERALWEALDEGRDPTVDEPSGGGTRD